MYEDKTLVCKECGNEFVFTAGEQEFYAERGFQNEPQRCKACRDARKNSARGPREYFTATCAACGGEARVPFEPKSDRPVYCSDCFAKIKVQQPVQPSACLAVELSGCCFAARCFLEHCSVPPSARYPLVLPVFRSLKGMEMERAS